MDRLLTLMVAQDTAIDFFLKPVDGFSRLSQQKQSELVWEYTNLIMKYPFTSLFGFWERAAEFDVREALDSRETDNALRYMSGPPAGV